MRNDFRHVVGHMNQSEYEKLVDEYLLEIHTQALICVTEKISSASAITFMKIMLFL